jgi:hypothetical protein
MKKFLVLGLSVFICLFLGGFLHADTETFKVNSMIFGGYPPGAEMSFDSGQHWATYYSWYDLNTDKFGILKGFCIEGDVSAPTGDALPATYELLGIGASYERLLNAAWVAENYLSSNRTLAQVLIWNLVEDNDYSLSTGQVQYRGTLLGDANLILAGLAMNSFTTGASGWVIAHSPVGTERNSQDYLVKNPVPEPASMMLFGAGLIIMTGYARKKKKKL